MMLNPDIRSSILVYDRASDSGFTGDWIFFAIELACPLVMRWLAVAADTVHRDLHFVAFGLVDHSAVLRRSRGEFRLRLFQFPDSHEVVLGETHWYSHKAQGHSQYDRSYFHVSS